MKKYSLLGYLFLIGIAVFIGLAGYTFFYAKGYSYLTNDPAACANCHVMRDFHSAWQVSSHCGATCNDCHVPHDPVRKYLVKAENGFWHSWSFTFDDVQVFRLRKSSEKVVEENCVRCHSGMVSMISHTGENRSCIRCHHGVGHKI